MANDPTDSDLLVAFEQQQIKGDYRRYYKIKRNNFAASIHEYPELWEFFTRLDEIWHRGLEDLEVAANGDHMFPVVLYASAHGKMRVSMELVFSACIGEARSILRDAVENIAHAHHMLRDPANIELWVKKDDGESEKKRFKASFEHDKKNGLFRDIPHLHSEYADLSETGSHPTMQSLGNRLVFQETPNSRGMLIHLSGIADEQSFALELFTRLLTCYVMEDTFFADFVARLKLDPQLVAMRMEFYKFKEDLRQTIIKRYNVRPPAQRPTKP